MNTKIRKEVRKAIGALRNERFENFANDILRLELRNLGTLETMVNKNEVQRKSKPDAHIIIRGRGEKRFIVINHSAFNCSLGIPYAMEALTIFSALSSLALIKISRSPVPRWCP